MVAKEEALRRLDVFLSERIKEGCSRTFIKQLILSRGVMVNKAYVKPHYKVNAGDSIRVVLPERSPAEIIPQRIELKIIYEDDDIMVIDKPSGLTVHPGAGRSSGTLVNALAAYTRNLSSINPERPGIVHRLDKDTSGLMVLAKNNAAHLNLAKQFSRHTVKKKYAALVRGRVEFDEGLIDLPIGRHRRDFRRRSVSFVHSKPALTSYRVLKRLAGTTLLELVPETGRTHQLRVHLAHIGHPILGDVKYGRGADFGRLALHARELGFMHPKSGKFVSFVSDLPQEFG